MKRNKNGRVRDQQRSRVYSWERLVVGKEDIGDMSLPSCQLLVCRCFGWWYRVGRPASNGRQFNIAIPDVVRGRENSLDAARGSSRTISLPLWARSKIVVLHETAHAIVDNHGLTAKDGGHGPYFMRVYIELLGHYMKFDRAYLTRSAKKEGIKVHPMYKIDRPKP